MYYTMYETSLIAKFKEEHNIDFFDAIVKLYDYIDETLLPFVPFKVEDIETIWHDKFIEVFNFINSIADKLISHRETIIANRIDNYFINSYKRCMGTSRRDTTSDVFFVAQTFFDEDKLRDIIMKNPHKWRNPLLLINNCEWMIPCIFKPSKALRDRYDFINIQLLWSHIIGATIDTTKLNEYDNIYINEDDILEFYYWMYHPYIWWLIQSRQWRQLTYNYNDLSSWS